MGSLTAFWILGCVGQRRWVSMQTECCKPVPHRGESLLLQTLLWHSALAELFFSVPERLWISHPSMAAPQRKYWKMNMHCRFIGRMLCVEENHLRSDFLCGWLIHGVSRMSCAANHRQHQVLQRHAPRDFYCIVRVGSLLRAWSQSMFLQVSIWFRDCFFCLVRYFFSNIEMF